MRIIQPSAEMLNFDSPTMGIVALSQIEKAARISHGSEDSQTPETWKRFIKNVVIDHGDWSVIEHVTVSVLLKVDRGVTHELVRHRLFSFTQSSTRFINYAKKMAPEFIYPRIGVYCEFCLAGSEPKPHSSDTEVPWIHSNNQYCSYDQAWLKAIQTSEDSYRELIYQGWRPQEARSVFPNALASTIQMTGNLRNWRHFFLMRTTIETHPQMREVVIPLLAKFKENIPLIFDDIEPGSRQIDALKKAR